MDKAFPWAAGGVTFRTRGELESALERLAAAGTAQHRTAAKALMHEAISLNKLSANQFTEIRERLRL